jgi:hypothetical protein
MTRWLVLACALTIGAIAPARAWCEATCLAPADTRSHCQTHEPADGTATISASVIDECPVLDSARPSPTARPHLQAALARAYVPSLVVRAHVTPPFDPSLEPATVFERCIPLRI